jgi:hypothetical protein
VTGGSSGSVVVRQLYDARGNTRLRGNLKTDIGYTAQREDLSTNLMFYRARYYSPSCCFVLIRGRCLQRLQQLRLAFRRHSGAPRVINRARPGPRQCVADRFFDRPEF